ncbi:MAG: acyl-CoA/acyl-ACP dehydrogenase [Acidimicrobiia bacterium]|nr:acyl-CoA/acyl-ACP dehydrogenase [Acidimicrobiia bacterium]
MELDFDPEHEDLRDSVRSVLAAECPISLVRDIVDTRFGGGASEPTRLIEQMVALGWPALTVPEAAGGLGFGPIELALVTEELGRALTPGPLFATLTQFVPMVTELGSVDDQETWLGPIAAGTGWGTVAIAEASGSIDPAATTVDATPTAHGWELSGTKHFVVEPTAGGEIVVVAREMGTTNDDGIGAFIVPVDAIRVEPIDGADPSRVLATVHLDQVAVTTDRMLGTPIPATAAGIRRANHVATVGLALDAVGAAQQAFDVSLEYVKQREQFGVPIGSFQAIKHKFADMLILLERARSLSYYAALTIAEDDDRRALATAMAKAAAGDAVARIAKEAIQVHGGIGYTWESDVHLYVRRIESDALLYGNANQHRQDVATLIGV